jgi:micrococcal nuclease
MSKRYIKYIVVVVLSLASLLYGLSDRYGPEVKKKTEIPANAPIRVKKVSDGDTISVYIGRRVEKIRFTGIDAPELGQKPWGRRSREHLQEIISGSSWKVVLEYDVVKRDKYERLLAYVRTPDGRLINEIMVQDGYAVLFTFPPNVKYTDLFTKAQKEARDKKLGIWGKNGLSQLPADYRKQNPRKY